MIDFSDAPDQKTGGGAIPPKSVVLLRLKIREATGKGATDHPLIKQFRTGLVGLDCEFEVVVGTFEGNKIWENLFLPVAMQPADMALTRGQEGICKSSHAKIRAIVEAARGIHPQEDNGPARSINDWHDLDGMVFPGLIGVKKVESGDEFINNTLTRVITIDREDYKNVMNGGEFVSELPLPELPEPNQAKGQPATQGYQSPAERQGQPQTTGQLPAQAYHNHPGAGGYQQKAAQGNAGAAHQGGKPQWATK